MLNAQDAIPLYEKLRDLLREQIEQGRYRPGEPIPSERELCRAHRISRITVRQAIAGMIHDGLLVRKQGKGTFVARRKVSQGLSRIVTFRRTVLDIGMKPSTRILSHGLLPADLEVASVLKLPGAGQVLRLVLLGRGDDQPLVVYESFFPPAIGRKMTAEARARERRNRPFSSYDLYARATGCTPARVSQALEAVAADDAPGAAAGGRPWDRAAAGHFHLHRPRRHAARTAARPLSRGLLQVQRRPGSLLSGTAVFAFDSVRAELVMTR